MTNPLSVLVSAFFTPFSVYKAKLCCLTHWSTFSFVE